MFRLLPAPPLRSVISQRWAVTFSVRGYLQAKIWTLGALIAVGVSLLPDAFQGTEPGNTRAGIKYTYLCTHSHIYICTYISVHWKTMCSHQYLQIPSNFTVFFLVFILSVFVALLSFLNILAHFMHLCASGLLSLLPLFPLVGSDALIQAIPACGCLPHPMWALDSRY